MYIDELFSGIMPGLPKPQIRMLAVPWYVGQFVMTWAKHERMLAGMISKIRQTDFRALRDKLLDGQIAGYETAIRETIDEIGADNAATPYLLDILAEHVSLRQLRNEIVHGHWSGIGQDDEFVVRRKERRNPESARTLTLEELAEGWKRLDRLGVIVINAGRAFEHKELL